MGPSPVGTPEMIADVMEKWIRDADIDVLQPTKRSVNSRKSKADPL
jgi:hypothetical protein